MIRLYLIRHGRQNSADCNVDVPLSEEGIKQAELLGERLKKNNIDVLYSSNLIRAVETAEKINEFLAVPHKRDDDLRELSFGDMEGIPNKDVKIIYKDFFDELNKREADLPYPGGECTEDGYIRGMAAIKRILKDAVAHNYKNIAVVTHGGIIRSIIAGLMGEQFSKRLVVARNLENCSITELDYDEAGDLFTIERINDYGHIEDYDNLLRKNFEH